MCSLRGWERVVKFIMYYKIIIPDEIKLHKKIRILTSCFEIEKGFFGGLELLKVLLS